MHIPDGFLDTKTVVATSVLAGVALGTSLRTLNRSLPRRDVPLMGLASAFVFAAQMINFPVAGGTSGHLMGGVLAAVLLGPAAGIVVISAVLIVQCFLFADGGILALGANILNMGVIGSVGGFGVYRLVAGLLRGERGRFVGIAVAAWSSTVLAAAVCAGELAWSGAAPWGAAFTAMVNVHMVIGLGEAVITVLVLTVIRASRPDLFTDPRIPRRGEHYTLVVAFGLTAALAIALFVAPFASPLPDGLERAAERLGIFESSTHAAASSVVRGYTVPGLGSTPAATAIAGAIGTIVVFLVGFILARIALPDDRRTVDR
jgi:cobalt/nickel transport system permease protein